MARKETFRRPKNQNNENPSSRVPGAASLQMNGERRKEGKQGERQRTRWQMCFDTRRERERERGTDVRYSRLSLFSLTDCSPFQSLLLPSPYFPFGLIGIILSCHHLFPHHSLRRRERRHQDLRDLENHHRGSLGRRSGRSD